MFNQTPTNMIYLDYNATTPLRLGVSEAICQTLAHYGNPSSTHALGRRAKAIIEDARNTLAKALNASAPQIIFTSGGTEANNSVIKGFRSLGARLLVSAIEHDSVIQLANANEIINVARQGLVDLDHLQKLLSQIRQNHSGPVMVAVMFANNETGTLQPVEKVVALCKQYNAYTHCDAVQVFGKRPIDFTALGVDTLSLSAHKIGGPKGVGALVVKPGIHFSPLLEGPGQERGMRSGTESTHNIAGFHAAILESQRDKWKAIEGLRNHLETSLKKVCPKLKIFGDQANRLVNTSCLAMPGVASEKQLMVFDLKGIALSSGAACSSGKNKFSHVLKAMGATDQEADQAIRVSLGWQTTPEDIETFIQVWTDVYRKHAKELE